MSGLRTSTNATEIPLSGFQFFCVRQSDSIQTSEVFVFTFSFEVKIFVLA